ncbi:MAG TPA: hypothetical protein VMD75_18665 [Candidatus Binataceae bacterium]|nr:hypothetical protein [Candidatus Binataceae bacterium]
MSKAKISSLGALSAGLAMFAVAGAASAQGFSAPLDQCSTVTVPTALTNCATVQDPLSGGGATISDEGDVTVTVIGAAPNTTYAVSLVSGDGTQSTPIGDLKTGSRGNGAMRKDAFFKFGTVGAGNIVLSSSSSAPNEEFVTGVSISSNGLVSGRDFQPGLVRCTDVVTPGALSSCGSDSLSSGHVDVENDDGALAIHVSGARPSTSYTALFVSPSGGTPTALGTVGPTNKKGNASLVVSSEFASGTIGSGWIELENGSSTDEFVSGFKVDEKFVSPEVSTSNLVPCDSVTDPADLVCGDDPLNSGHYDVDKAGNVSVTLNGAEPSTNYEVYFRPLDDSGDVDTGLEVPTNANGNAVRSAKNVFVADTVASGTLVLKHTGSDQSDQFVAGFEVH